MPRAPWPWWLRWLAPHESEPPMTRPIPLPPPFPVKPGGEDAPGLAAAINAERRARGMSELSSNTRLNLLAADWAKQMAAVGRLDHGDSYARLAPYFPGQASAENAAAGQQGPAEVVRDWLTSPGHRDNMLGVYTLIGCGKAASKDGMTYWCADFVR